MTEKPGLTVCAIYMDNEQLRFPSPSIWGRVTVWVGNTAKFASLPVFP